MKIVMPDQVGIIIEELLQRGFEAYAVGGCIRDSLLHREPNDWDITTSASPQQVKQIFRRTVDTGIAHGTVTVLLGSEGYEVTTYRLDGDYEDGRHPKEVFFTGNLTEDLKRRDFTINAMAYNQKDGLVDCFDGTGDLERKVIRCVGNPRERFQEDALRILRAVRFSAQLGFSIEEKTGKALRELAPTLNKISAERIQAEMVKLVRSKHPEYLEKAWQYGITAVIFPEYDAMAPERMQSTLQTIKKVEDSRVLRLTALLFQCGEGTTDCVVKAERVLKRWKFDNDTLRKVKLLLTVQDHLPTTKTEVRRLLYQIGKEMFPDYLKFQTAKAQEAQLAKLEKIQQMEEEIIAKGECTCMKELHLTGRDLIEDGWKPGKELGDMLQTMLEEVLEHPEWNQKEKLMERAKSLAHKS